MSELPNKFGQFFNGIAVTRVDSDDGRCPLTCFSNRDIELRCDVFQLREQACCSALLRPKQLLAQSRQLRAPASLHGNQLATEDRVPFPEQIPTVAIGESNHLYRACELSSLVDRTQQSKQLRLEMIACFTTQDPSWLDDDPAHIYGASYSRRQGSHVSLGSVNGRTQFSAHMQTTAYHAVTRQARILRCPRPRRLF